MVLNFPSPSRTEDGNVLPPTSPTSTFFFPHFGRFKECITAAVGKVTDVAIGASLWFTASAGNSLNLQVHQLQDNQVVIRLRSIHLVLIKAKISILLPFGPLAILLHYLTGKHGLVFFLSMLGIAPLVERLGYATEQLAFHMGPTIGVLLNITFGNATEMMVSIYELKNGMTKVVQYLLLGSILSNMLSVLGCAFIAGGIVHFRKDQYFNKHTVLVHSGFLLMAVMGIMFPSLLHVTQTEFHSRKSELTVSRFSSCVMLVAYASYIVFQLKHGRNSHHHTSDVDKEETEAAGITQREAIGWLAVLTLWLSVLSYYLVGATEGVSESMNIPVTFVSVILLPIATNAGKHASAIMFAMKNKLDSTLRVAIGSATWISLFMMPFCVVVGWFMGKPMDLNFQLFEIATLFTAGLLVAFMLQAGEANYLKGLILFLCYLIVAVYFFVLVDPSNDEDLLRSGFRATGLQLRLAARRKP